MPSNTTPFIHADVLRKQLTRGCSVNCPASDITLDPTRSDHATSLVVKRVKYSAPTLSLSLCHKLSEPILRLVDRLSSVQNTCRSTRAWVHFIPMHIPSSITRTSLHKATSVPLSAIQLSFPIRRLYVLLSVRPVIHDKSPATTRQCIVHPSS